MILVAIFFIPDEFGKVTTIISALVVIFAVQQTFAAQSSAKAAESSARLAEFAGKQATYIHLANLWYDIKKRGLENSLFIQPEFTTLYRQEEYLDKYRDYHIYAWLCWGHAEDCFHNNFHSDVGFKPSIANYKELHYAWFLTPKNKKMFSDNFIKWVEEKILIPDVIVKSEFTFEGKGVFAKRDFSERSFIGFFKGEEKKNRTKMSLQFNQTIHIEPALHTPFRYLNHSCNANAYFRGRNLYSWCRITKDEEITIDYNCTEPELSFPFECNCKTSGCVQTVRGFKSLTADQKNSKSEKIAKWLFENNT